MAIDHETETLVTFAEARTLFPGGKRVALQTLHRWRQHGVCGVKLETILWRRLRMTSREAIVRFIRAVDAAQDSATETQSKGVTPAQRQRQSDAARKSLAKAGV